MRIAIGAGLALLLAGCGGGTSVTATSNTSSTTTTTTTIDSSREPPGDAKMADPATASGGTNDCSKNPAFTPIYAGASVRVCSSVHFGNTGKDSGSVSYTTDATPAAVIAFGKEQAAKAGMKVRIESETMLSASEGAKRGFAMFVSAEGSGAKVTVNWNNTP